MTDDAKPDDPPAPPPAVVVVPPPAPASVNDGVGAQSARVLGIAVGGALTAWLSTSPVAAAAIIPAFGVIAVWAYGVWERRKSNRDKINLHTILHDVTGGWLT